MKLARLWLNFLIAFTALEASGAFYAHGLVGERWNFVELAKGDFTGDGKTDLLGRSTDGKIYLYEYDPKAAAVYPWVERGVVAVGWTFTHYLVGDFTGDGKDDLVGRNSDGQLYLYEYDPKGEVLYPWIEHGLVGSGWNFSDYIVGDFTGDKRADLLGRHADGTVYLYSYMK